MKKHIPNLFTLGNLFLGCLGIYFWSHGNLEWAAWCILAAGLFDFFDGFAARLLGVANPIGKDLDSLADVVSFGVLPGFLLFALFPEDAGWLRFSAFMIPLASAYRLAKFNNDESQSTSFKGLPTPASALFASGLVFFSLSERFSELKEGILSSVSLVAVSLLLAVLMISNLKLLALKFKSYDFGSNVWRYILIVLSLLILLFFRLSGLTLVIVFYLIISLISTPKEYNEIPGES